MTSRDSAAFLFPTSERHEPGHATQARPSAHTPTESAIDHGIEESFPASDPVSVSVARTEPAPARAPAAPHVPTPDRAPAQTVSARTLTWASAAFAIGLATGCAVTARGRR
jgi:hypothetical protein